MLVGYIWTVNANDHTSRNEQYQALINAGVTAACIYEDLGCLRQAEHPERQECLQALEMGDTLVTGQLDGLACDRAALLDILRDLAKRQIGLKILDEQASLIDTAHISLDVMIGLIDAFTAFEDRAFRALKEKGVAAARARGQAFGPKRKMTATMLRQAMDLIANSDQSFTSIAKQFGFTRSGLYKYLNGDGSPKPPARQILEADRATAEDLSAEDDSSSSSTNR